jgi:hypothetical protein
MSGNRSGAIEPHLSMNFYRVGRRFEKTGIGPVAGSLSLASIGGLEIEGRVKPLTVCGTNFEQVQVLNKHFTRADYSCRLERVSPF